MRNHRTYPHAAVIGTRPNGRPMYAMAGGDATATAEVQVQTAEQLQTLDDGALDAERTRVLGLLDGGNTTEQLSGYATRISAELVRRDGARVGATNARAVLANAPVPNRGDSGGASGGAAGGGAEGGSDDLVDQVLAALGTRVRGADDHRTAASIGQTFTRSQPWEAYRANGYSGQVAVELPEVNIRSLIDTGATSAGAFVVPFRDTTTMPNVTRDRPLYITDLIDRRTTTGTTVEYVRENVLTNSAAETAEGQPKPESTVTFEVITDTTRTIAHWANLTRQAAEDNGQVQGYLEGRLTYGLQRRLNDQILNGNGTSPNLRGIMQTSGIGTYTAAVNEAAVISVRRAITVAQLSEYAPDTVVMNPVDWERVELSVDGQGRFRVTPNVQGTLVQRLWGLTVVVSMSMTGTVDTVSGGKFLVGSFREGATLWERDGVRVLMTDSHASNFTSNILTLLLEMRAALSVWRPKAFVLGTFSVNASV